MYVKMRLQLFCGCFSSLNLGKLVSLHVPAIIQRCHGIEHLHIFKIYPGLLACKIVKGFSIFLKEMIVNVSIISKQPLYYTCMSGQIQDGRDKTKFSKMRKKPCVQNQ